MLIILALFHFLIYLGRKNELSNLSYSLHNLAFTFNIIHSILYKHFLIISFKTFTIFLSISICFIALSFTFFIFTIFNLRKILKPIIIYDFFIIICTIFSIIAYIITDKIIFGKLPIFICTIYAVYLSIPAVITILKTKQYKENNFKKMIFIGIIVMLISYFIFGILKSIFIKLQIGNYMFIPNFILISFFEYAFINQFNSIYHNLETQVKERTNTIKLLEEKRKIFFINFAHEIKTPLTLISNCMERTYQNIKNLYKNNNNGNNIDLITKDIDIIRDNMARIQSDIVNFLDAEKIERSQQIYKHNQVVNFSKILLQKIILFQNGIKNKKIFLSYKIDDNIFIKIDTFALDRIINNLIDNAIKYIKEKGIINISLKEKNNKIEFIVQDTGIGIDKKEIDHIFLPFSQLSKEKNQFQGMGLGLTIVKNILDKINAKIKVESKLNEGSVFKIIFDRYALKKEDIIQNNFNYSENLIISSSLPENIISETLIFDINNPTILLIEDNLEMISFLQESLKKKYNFFYSSNGEQALQKLENMPKPDIIISDIMMDVMDGYEFYDKIKNNNLYNNIPFLFLTAKSGLDEKIKGLSKGAIDFITKPFDLDELLAKIKSILKINKLKEKSIIEAIYETSKKQLEELNDNKINYNDIKEKYNLSNNEIEICKLIKEKLSNKEIGTILNKAESTVKNYIQVIFQKLSVNKREKVIDILLEYEESTF